MPEVFDPSIYPALIALGQQVRELAGDAAYRAGRDYLRKGMVSDSTVTDSQAHAVVRGSTEYRISITFGGSAAAKVTCTCPAHRRSKHCKHVVAVSVALVEQPTMFQIVEAADIPVVAPPTRKRRDPAAKQKAEALKGDQLQSGLVLVDRLLDELAGTGMSGLGPEQLTLLASVSDTVQGLKLRRLGNGLTALHRLIVEHGNDEATPTAFAALLSDLLLMRQVIGASLNGGVTLDPGLQEELIGKTWRAKDLEQVTGLELVTLARLTEEDGDFRVESMYLHDLSRNEIFVERHITPRGLRGDRFPVRRMKTLVDEAGLYPGLTPRRIKLVATRETALLMSDIERVVACGIEDIAGLRSQLVERLSVPVGAGELAVLVRPNRIVWIGDYLAVADPQGDVLPLAMPDSWSKPIVRGMTQEAGRYVILGLMELTGVGPRLRCLSLIGDLSWANGPTYPVLS